MCRVEFAKTPHRGSDLDRLWIYVPELLLLLESSDLYAKSMTASRWRLFSFILSFLCFLLFFRLSQACCYENCTTRYVIFPQNSRSNRRLFLTSRSVETRTSVVEGLKAALDVHADLISVRQLPRHHHPHHSSLSSSSSSSTISDLTHHTT